MTRVYVPSTTGRLRGIVTASGIGPAPFAAHAVTDEVRRELGDVDDEDLEYAASSAAALSLRTPAGRGRARRAVASGGAGDRRAVHGVPCVHGGCR